MQAIREGRQMYQSIEYQNGYDESLARAVAALNEGIADEKKIIGLLQKHWDLSLMDARMYLARERTEGYPMRELSAYLAEYMGWDFEDAQDYACSDEVAEALRTIDKPWGLSGEKLYEKVWKALNSRA